jgi:hypothetical protein
MSKAENAIFAAILVSLEKELAKKMAILGTKTTRV